jgi:hypothetical protein
MIKRNASIVACGICALPTIVERAYHLCPACGNILCVSCRELHECNFGAPAGATRIDLGDLSHVDVDSSCPPDGIHILDFSKVRRMPDDSLVEVDGRGALVRQIHPKEQTP